MADAKDFLFEIGTEEMPSAPLNNAVKQLGHSDQCADDAGIQADGVGQVNHNERGEERIDHVARNIAGSVSDLVIPF